MAELNIRVVLCEGPGEVSQEQYDIVWTTAQPLIAAMMQTLFLWERTVGRNAVATAMFTVAATMLSRHPAGEREAILDLINKGIAAHDAGTADESEDDAHPLSGMTTMGNA